MEKGKISSLQMVIMIYPTIMATIILSLPSITSKYAKIDFWMSPIFGSLLGFATVYIAYKLHELYPKQTVIQYSEQIIGKFAGKTLSIFILFFYLMTAGHIVREYSEFITDAFLDQTPNTAIIAIMIFTCALAIRGGLEVVGRVSLILSPLFVLPLLVMIILLLTKFEYQNIFPMFADGIIPPMKAAIIPGSWFTEFFLLSFFLPFLTDEKKGKKFGMMSVIAVMVTFVIVDLIVLFILGPTTDSKIYPLLNVAKFIRIGEFIENIEAIVMAVWIAGAFVKISVFYYAVSLGTAQLLNLSSYRSIVWPLGILVVIFSFWSLPGTLDLTRYTIGTFVPLALLVQFVLPLLLLGIALLRKRKK